MRVDTSRTSDGLIVNTVTGAVDTTTLRTFVTERVQSWADAPIIWDLAGAEVASVQAGDLASLAKLVAPVTGLRAGKRSAIVGQSDLQFGMSKVFSSMAEVYDIKTELRIFRTVDEARAWLLEGA
jgi:hypothetical protein